MHPDPDGSEIICKLGSGSVINSGFESGSKLGSVFLNNPDPKMYRFKKFAFLRRLDDLHFKCIFHEQSGSGSEIKVKVGSGSEKKKKN